jgi:hypothetical protein
MDHFLTTDGSDIHNQAPGQVRGRATEGWPEGRIETLGQVEKDCRKAAPKEERVGKTCESNERERTSQIGRQKNHRVDSLHECWICCGKDTRKRACGCFFTTSPRLETKRKLVFSKRFLGEAGPFAEQNGRWAFHNPVRACL